MKLADLDPRFSPLGGAYQSVSFLCPRCRKHEIAIDIWNGSHGDHAVPLNGLPPGQGITAGKRLWHGDVPADGRWDLLSVTPSIDRSGMDACGGWHGHITNGRIEGGI